MLYDRSHLSHFVNRFSITITGQHAYRLFNSHYLFCLSIHTISMKWNPIKSTHRIKQMYKIWNSRLLILFPLSIMVFVISMSWLWIGWWNCQLQGAHNVTLHSFRVVLIQHRMKPRTQYLNMCVNKWLLLSVIGCQDYLTFSVFFLNQRYFYKLICLISFDLVDEIACSKTIKRIIARHKLSNNYFIW